MTVSDVEMKSALSKQLRTSGVLGLHGGWSFYVANNLDTRESLDSFAVTMHGHLDIS